MMGGSAFQKRNHQNSHYIKKSMLFLGGLGHVGRDRPNQAVAKQDAEERSHQGSGNLVTDFFGRAAKGAHGNHDTEHRRHNAEAGQRISHGAESGSRGGRIVMMNFQVKIQHLVEVEGVDAGDGGAQESQTKSQR